MTQPNDPTDPEPVRDEAGHAAPGPGAPPEASPEASPEATPGTEPPAEDPEAVAADPASEAPSPVDTPVAADEPAAPEGPAPADAPVAADDSPVTPRTLPPEPEGTAAGGAGGVAEGTDDGTAAGGAEGSTEGAGDEDGPLTPSRSGSPSWALVVVVLLGVVIVGAGAYLLGSSPDDETVASTTTTADASTPTVDPDIEFTEFDDPVTGVSFRYPSDWVQLEPAEPDPTVPVILSAGGSNSLLVRVVPIEEPVTEENLPNLKATTDGILDDAGVSILEETAVTVNGMPGYFYLYFIDDTASGQQGAHAHYFLFKEATMNILVFQSVPTEAFTDLAPVFDEIVNSFESDPPDAPPAATTTTTTAPASPGTTAPPAPDSTPSTAPSG